MENMKRSYAWNMHYGADSITKKQAKELRKNMTEAENILWENLRNKKLGYKFRRQHAIGIYIADFYCHALNLVVEVDGAIHKNEIQSKWDDNRTHDMNLKKIHVIRFSNEEVLSNIQAVLSRITVKCNEINEINSI